MRKQRFDGKKCNIQEEKNGSVFESANCYMSTVRPDNTLTAETFVFK